MSIRTLRIENFQSIKKAEIEFGQFTAFLGQNSCGKTASLRALRAMATNDRKAASYISFWANSFKVTAITDTAEVVYKRTATTSSYVVTVDSESKEYTKLQGTVPEEVSQALGIWPEDCELLLRDQHQGPYLLRESGSDIARVFGGLTNADVLLVASREANRLKSASSATIKVRETDINKFDSQLSSAVVVTLKTAKTLLSDIQPRVAKLKESQLIIDDLRAKISQYESAESRVSSCKIFDLPDLDKLIQADTELTDFALALKQFATLKSEVSEKSSEFLEANNEVEMYDSFIKRALEEWGVCPVCERSV